MVDSSNQSDAGDGGAHRADLRDNAGGLDGLVVRTYEPRDQPAVNRLYTEGLLAGQIADNDTGADIENIQEGYFGDERHHFWVVEAGDRVVGMIGVAADEDHSAEIRRLRLDPDLQDQTEIAYLLLETAVSHCKHHGFLKVLLDTRFEHEAAVGVFDRLGFLHNRTRAIHGKDLLEFYLDLYRQPRPE